MSRLTAQTEMQPRLSDGRRGCRQSGSGPRRLEFYHPDVQGLPAQNGKLVRIRGSQSLFKVREPVDYSRSAWRRCLSERLSGLVVCFSERNRSIALWCVLSSTRPEVSCAAQCDAKLRARSDSAPGHFHLLIEPQPQSRYRSPGLRLRQEFVQNGTDLTPGGRANLPD